VFYVTKAHAQGTPEDKIIATESVETEVKEGVVSGTAQAILRNVLFTKSVQGGHDHFFAELCLSAKCGKGVGGGDMRVQ
jgi:hypothetical protein